jgi:peptidoglycan/xylan/chitin deacetylase (PgdA/CDA1 family)
LSSTNRVIQHETGVATRYMRPPFGDYDSEVVRISNQLGLEVIMWTIDTNDWSNLNGAYGAIERELGWGESAIILMHDWTGISRDLQAIIDLGRRRGYRFVNMDECLQRGGSNFKQTTGAWGLSFVSTEAEHVEEYVGLEYN